MENQVELNLEGINGNAFAIMGAFTKAAKTEGWDQSEIDKVLNEAMAGDYDHLLQTIIKHTY